MRLFVYCGTYLGSQGYSIPIFFSIILLTAYQKPEIQEVKQCKYVTLWEIILQS